ncbi:MAG: PAS domain-containing protein [Alphaproteobacteria bacterium]|nr:PAS domain-containing protein [Alphaproteobacteria bacterium]
MSKPRVRALTLVLWLNPMPRKISNRCREFLDHWESLRGGKVMPSLQDFLDHPNPDLQPSVMITDIISRTEIPIRLFGTALVKLVRADPTGRNFIGTFSPPGVSDPFADMGQVLTSQPCGTSNIKNAITANGHDAEIDSITLPLSTADGSPPCLAGYFQCVTELEPDDFIYQVVGYGESMFVDIGAGVPTSGVSENLDEDAVDVGSDADRFRTFEEHWRLLRGEAMVPKLSDFLNRPIPILQPNVTILDLVSAKMLRFRLIGTSIAETFGMDATGQNILDFMPLADGKVLSEVSHQIVAHCCGVEIKTDVVTSTGRSMVSGSVGFPLLRKAGETECVVWFNAIGEPNTYGEPVVSMSGFERVAWIDAGAGVPD